MLVLLVLVLLVLLSHTHPLASPALPPPCTDPQFVSIGIGNFSGLLRLLGASMLESCCVRWSDQGNTYIYIYIYINGVVALGIVKRWVQLGDRRFRVCGLMGVWLLCRWVEECCSEWYVGQTPSGSRFGSCCERNLLLGTMPEEQRSKIFNAAAGAGAGACHFYFFLKLILFKNIMFCKRQLTCQCFSFLGCFWSGFFLFSFFLLRTA